MPGIRWHGRYGIACERQTYRCNTLKLPNSTCISHVLRRWQSRRSVAQNYGAETAKCERNSTVILPGSSPNSFLTEWHNRIPQNECALDKCIERPNAGTEDSPTCRRLMPPAKPRLSYLGTMFGSIIVRGHSALLTRRIPSHALDTQPRRLTHSTLLRHPTLHTTPYSRSRPAM
jgi:hypothetical protein